MASFPVIECPYAGSDIQSPFKNSKIFKAPIIIEGYQTFEVVKIRIKTIAVFALVFALMLPFAFAQGNMLSVRDVEFEVNGDRETGTIDVKPDSTLEISFEVLNEYLDSDPLASEIVDITATVTIEGIDDGDDLENDEDVDDLDPGDDDRVKIEFDLPLELDHDDDYILVIEVEGKDDLNRSNVHVFREEYDLKVDKERHDIRILNAEFLTPILRCARTTSLSLNIINLGREDEDDVRLTITSPELEISKADTFDLTEDPFDDENRYRSTMSVTVPSGMQPGVYPVAVRVEYDDGGELAEEILDLTVEECEAEEPDPEDQVDDEEEQEDDTTVVIQEPPVIQPPVVSPPVTAPVDDTKDDAEQDQSLFSSPWFIGLIIVLDIIIVLVGVILILSLTRRKN